MARNKPPRWYRIMRYGFNCIWYHILFPLGQEEDLLMTDLKKLTRNQKTNKNRL